MEKHGHSALSNHGRAFVCCLISFFVLAAAVLIGRLEERKISRIMLPSVLCGILIGLYGITASYFIELPSGASIILIGGMLPGLVKGMKRLAGRKSAGP